MQNKLVLLFEPNILEFIHNKLSFFLTMVLDFVMFAYIILPWGTFTLIKFYSYKVLKPASHNP